MSTYDKETFKKFFEEFFNLADKNKNGSLSYNEVKRMLKNTLGISNSEEDIEKWFDGAGVKRGEQVSFKQLWDTDILLRFADNSPAKAGKCNFL